MFFKKNKKNFQYSQYSQKSNNTHGNIMTAFDKIKFVVINENKDEKLFDACDAILSGHPLLLKFESLEINDANKMLAFISGVIYATEGKIFKVESHLFLLGRKEEFEDGSLYQYYEDLTS